MEFFFFVFFLRVYFCMYVFKMTDSSCGVTCLSLLTVQQCSEALLPCVFAACCKGEPEI